MLKDYSNFAGTRVRNCIELRWGAVCIVLFTQKSCEQLTSEPAADLRTAVAYRLAEL